MHLAAFFAIMIVVLGISYKSTMLEKLSFEHAARGSHNPITKRFEHLSKNYGQQTSASYKTAEDLQVEDMQVIENTMLRTCRTLHTLALANNCASPYNESVIWGFIGSVGTSSSQGNLSVIWSGSTASTFSCANINGYGRKIMREALPKSFVTSKGFKYDFRNMNDSAFTDPCGYEDFIN